MKNIIVQIIGTFAIAASMISLSSCSTVGDDSASSHNLNKPGAPRLLQPKTIHNKAYGFEVTAPAGSAVKASFATSYLVKNTWRFNAPNEGSASTGTPIVAISLLQINSPSKVYPAYFTTEVRIGVSPNTADCYKTDFPNQKVVDVNINGETFKKFSFADAAMMHYVQGESYRAIHGDRCFAIERIKAGSNYRESGMKKAFSDKELDSYYAQTEKVVQSFKFVTPQR